jgi:hypothetical protein
VGRGGEGRGGEVSFLRAHKLPKLISSDLKRDCCNSISVQEKIDENRTITFTSLFCAAIMFDFWKILDEKQNLAIRPLCNRKEISKRVYTFFSGIV